MKKSFLLLFSIALGVIVPGMLQAKSDPWIQSSEMKSSAFDIGSIFFLNFDLEKKIINQTHGGSDLILDDFRGGFRVIQNKSVSIGNPPIWNFIIPVGIPVGLNLNIDTQVTTDRFIQNKAELENLPRVSIPLRPKDLASWKTGDNLSFGADGGIGFSVGVGWGVVGAGPYFFAQGSWYIYVEKTDTNSAYLKITNGNLHSLGAAAGSSFVSIGIEKFQQADTGFSFNYDLTDPKAILAYEDAIRGNIEPTEKLADAPNATAVQRRATHKNAFMGFMRNWYFGLPLFWNSTAASGKVYVINQERLHADQTKSLVRYAVSVNESATNGIASNRKRTIRNFYAYHYSHAGLRGRNSHGYSGEFIWGHEQEKMSQKQFQKAFNKLLTELNLKTRLGMQIPNEKFGYLNIQFETKLPEETTNALIAKASGSPEEVHALFKGSAQSEIEQYFMNGTDPDGICIKSSRNTENESIPKCRARLIRESNEATQLAALELRLMESAKISDPESFVKHFAEFGKQLTENRFVFDGVLKLVKESPIEMSLSMEGERISILSKDVSRSLLF